jgi:hypothetical protein
MCTYFLDLIVGLLKSEHRFAIMFEQYFLGGIRDVDQHLFVDFDSDLGWKGEE